MREDKEEAAGARLFRRLLFTHVPRPTVPFHSTTIVRQAPAIGRFRRRHAWVASSLTARPQLRLPAPWKLTRASNGGMARPRAVTVTCHCALPRPCQGAGRAIVQRTPRQAHPVIGSDAGPDRATPPPSCDQPIDRSMDQGPRRTDSAARCQCVTWRGTGRPAGLARASSVPRASLTRTSVSQRRARPRCRSLWLGHRGL